MKDHPSTKGNIMHERLAAVKDQIKTNPLPFLAATAGATVGIALGYKLGVANTVTVGKWVQDLEEKGCSIVIMTNGHADKMYPTIPKR